MLQTTLFNPKASWEPIPVSRLPSWEGARRVAVDVETKDPDLEDLGPGVRRRDSYVVGISFAIEDGPCHYLPVGHAAGGNLEPRKAWAYLADQATGFHGTVVGANLSYDLDWLAENGVVYRRARWFRDVEIAEPLLDEMRDSYSLDSIAAAHGVTGKDETLLREAAAAADVDPKAGLWKLHSKYVGAYAEQDARLPLTILRRQEKLIDDQDLWRVFDLESRSLPVFVKMTRRGIRVDPKRLERIADWALEVETECLARVRHATGVDIQVGDCDKAALINRCLKEIGIDLPLTSQGQPCIAKDVLDGYDHEVVGWIKRARKFSKCRTTFVASMYRFITGGRVHASFAQLRRQREDGGVRGPAYGRSSAYKPNVQQQYKRDKEIAKPWRSIFVGDEGKLWASNDFSQQEPRLAVHYAVACGCPKAEEAARRYREDPTTDSHSMMAALMYDEFDPADLDSDDEDAAGEARRMRGHAKNTYLGLSYGMGGGKLCRRMGLPTIFVNKTWGDRQGKWEKAGPEGQAVLDRFNVRVPYIRALTEKAEDQAKANGYIRTLFGRRCRFPIKRGKYDWTHKALNRLIQGSAADQTKACMVEADRLGFPLQVAVHDEIDLSVDNLEQAQELARVMKQAVELLVPSKVEVEIGESWGQAC